jgi:hypothetical protein
VQAPIEVRIERIANRESVDRETARWLVQKTDADRACFLMTIYGKHWDDPAEYDKVIAIRGQAVDEAVKEVKAALAKTQKRDTEEARKLLQMSVLAANVKAGIATNPHFFIPTLDVFYDGTEIVLRGLPTPRRSTSKSRKRHGTGWWTPDTVRAPLQAMI